MADSKSNILEALLKEDLSIDELCTRVGVSPTAVRQHIDSLEASGHITRKPAKQKIGRPKFLYSLTEKGGASFPRAYQDFLSWMMDEILEFEGVAGLKKLLTKAAKRNAVRYKGKFEGKSIEDKLRILGEILNEVGAYSEIKKANGGFEINVYNCLLSSVAKKYDHVVCEYDATFLETLLGRRIKKIRSKTTGAKCCSFRVAK